MADERPVAAVIMATLERTFDAACCSRWCFVQNVTAVSGRTDVARKTRMRRVRTLMGCPGAPERFDGEPYKYVRL